MENPVNDLFDGWPWLHLNLADETTQMAHWLRCGTRIELYVDFAIHPLFTVINNSLQQQYINLLVFVRRSGWRPIPVQSSPLVPPATVPRERLLPGQSFWSADSSPDGEYQQQQEQERKRQTWLIRTRSGRQIANVRPDPPGSHWPGLHPSSSHSLFDTISLRSE